VARAVVRATRCCASDFHSPLENSDLEFRVTVTASVPGESNHEAVPPDDVARGVGRQAVAPRGGNVAFPRNARLLRHADFERVYKQGRRHFSASMTVFYWPRPAIDAAGAKAPAVRVPVASGLRIGFTVSRALGGAVQRNRMKRRLREAVRMTRPAAGPNADVVINPKKSLLTVDFTAVVNEVGRAFVVIQEKLAGKAAREKA
jgi:ribonuclease P protein component